MAIIIKVLKAASSLTKCTVFTCITMLGAGLGAFHLIPLKMLTANFQTV
jgi:hypothetical protein